MPFLRLKEIREMSHEKRAERLVELHTELSRLRAMARVGGSTDNPSKSREIKRAIARIMTIESEGRTRVKAEQ